jgi:hypothetical protein
MPFASDDDVRIHCRVEGGGRPLVADGAAR